MDNRNISLILSDLDGTLLHDDKSISEYSKKIIAQAQSRGILFGISTSRDRMNAEKLLAGIKPDLLITNSGGLVKISHTELVSESIIYTCEFTIDEIRTLIKATFDVCGPNVVISVDNDHSLYSNSKEELGDNNWTYTDFSDFDEPAMKLCIETLDLAIVEKIASSIGIDKIDYHPFSDIPWYKLSKKGATKEKAIEVLCEHLKITPSQIAAFGDDFSDIGMLKLCGKGLAMENAIPEVKQIADEVCASNEADGLAEWIKNHLL